MTREECFKENFPEYVTEKGECLSPYFDLFNAGVEWATYELNKGCIQTLTKENRILKETLYCSKETCDNCGNIHCENFQRQRKSEPCSMHISYKARIKNLEHENDVLTESYNNSEMNLQNCSRELEDAKELIKDFLRMAKLHLKDRYETVEEAEKSLEEN